MEVKVVRLVVFVEFELVDVGELEFGVDGG